MVRILVCLLLSAISLLAETPWPDVPYTEVRAFAWEPDKTPYTEKLIRPDMSFAPGLIHPQGTLLNAEQIKVLLAAQARRNPTGGFIGSLCYEPHNAFVFYSDHKPVAWLEMCFDCMGWKMFPPDQGSEPYLPALAAIFSELKLPLGRQAGTLDDIKKNYEATYARPTPGGPPPSPAP